MTDVSRPTLSQTGQIYVSQAAAQRFREVREYKEHEIETARRELTELLLDARQQPRDPHMWRARKRSTKLDITAVVKPEGRLLVVTFISVQAYDPPSRTSGDQKRGRSRFPDDLRTGPVPSRGTSIARAPGVRNRRKATRTI